MVSNSWNATVLAWRSFSLIPTRDLSSSDETISVGAKLAAAQVLFPDELGPINTTTHGAGRRVSIYGF
jgi:hypothetical protein